MDLTTIFGSDITVTVQPRKADRQFVGFSGANGMTSMNLGTRGRQITVTGRLYAAGANYNAARANLQAVIDAIESYQSALAADYTYRSLFAFYSSLHEDNRQIRFVTHCTAGIR